MNVHPHDLAGQQKAQAEQAKKRAELRAIELADTMELMRHDWGRRIVWRLMDRARIYSDGNDVQTNATEAAHCRGRKFTVQLLDDQIRVHCHKEWLQMSAENGAPEIGQ